MCVEPRFVKLEKFEDDEWIPVEFDDLRPGDVMRRTDGTGGVYRVDGQPKLMSEPPYGEVIVSECEETFDADARPDS